MNICIIVLNWNGWRHTLSCLDSLHTLLNTPSIRLIVCDNGSDDDSWRHLSVWLEQHLDAEQYAIYAHSPPETLIPTTVTLLQTGKNLGFAGGMNVGLRHALGYFDCDYVWLLNNDLEVDAQALLALQACSQAQPQWGMIGSTIMETDNRQTVQCAGGCRYYPWLTVFRNRGQGLTLPQALALPECRLDYAQGAALWLKVEAIKNVGVLNEEYFLFYEELDYAQRLRRAGYEIGWCRHSRVYHQGSATIGAHSQDRPRLQQAHYYENLSTLKYSRNYYPYRLWLILPLRLGLKMLALLLRRQFFLLPLLFKAYKDFFTEN